MDLRVKREEREGAGRMARRRPLRRQFLPSERPARVDVVLRASARLTGASVPCLLRGDRDRVTSSARAVACAALRRLGYSTTLIGMMLGGCTERAVCMDHSSVIAASRRAEGAWPSAVVAVQTAGLMDESGAAAYCAAARRAAGAA